MEQMEWKQKIENAEQVVIGIGRELSAQKRIPKEDVAVHHFYHQLGYHGYEMGTDYQKEIYYRYYLIKEGVIPAYNQLFEWMKEREYFVITSNEDGLIYQSKLNTERVVAPCGNGFYLQCSKPCTNTLYEAEPYLLAAIEDLENGQKEPVMICPLCKQPLLFHIRTQETKSVYLEQGYLPAFDRYKNFLARTLNRNVLFLELGEGFENPSLIRWPFEKMAYLNQKASFIRVHDILSQVQEELAGKAITIKKNAVDFIEELAADKIKD